jgi:toxin ParE1/3/4
VTRLVVSDAARADLRAIKSYTKKEWGASRGGQYITAINDRFKSLRKRPEIAPIRKDIPGNLRGVAIGRHLIFYRYEDEVVLIVRILHQQMDVRIHL